jgi:hypothetical protein
MDHDDPKEARLVTQSGLAMNQYSTILSFLIINSLLPRIDDNQVRSSF